MQLAESIGDATPVCLGLWRSALYVGHHHQASGERPAVLRRNRHGHGHAVAVEVLEEPCLPRQIGVAAFAQTRDCKFTVDTHAPHVVGHSARERFDAKGVVAPQP